MILGFTTVEFICNIIFYAEFCVFLHSVLTPCFRPCVTYASYPLLIVVVLLASTVFTRMSLLRILTLPVLLMAYNLLFYRDKVLRSMFAAWLVPVIIFLSEIIVIAFVYNEEMLNASLHEAPIREQILCWGVEMVSGGVLYWFTAMALNRVRNRFSVREMLMYTFFPISQFLLLYGWIDTARQLERSVDQQLLILAVMVICLAAHVGLFASMILVSRKIELEAENSQLSAQIEAQLTHYADLTAQYEHIRRMRHDINKHLNAMKSLLAAGRSEDAAAYVDEISTAPFDVRLGICEHPVVDAFLHSASAKAQENGFTLDALITVPADISIASADLVCTYGNLLENAFEACKGVCGATVILRTAIDSGHLIISTENPIGPRTGRETRVEGLERGIGFRVLKDLAEKYNGNFRYTAMDNTFRTEITYELKG